MFRVFHDCRMPLFSQSLSCFRILLFLFLSFLSLSLCFAWGVEHLRSCLKEYNLCLVSFREACINFIDLCKKKNEDRLWVDEIAAMQAFSQPELPYLGTSGIMLAGEDHENSQNIMINVHPNSLSNGKQNGSADASDSTASHGSLEGSQGMVEYSICHNTLEASFDL